MKDVIIKRNILHGEVLIPSSKSIGHRALICAALSNGKSNIFNLSLSEDIKATFEGISKLGAQVSLLDDKVVIEASGDLKVFDDTIDCVESGSTLRFLIPIAATIGQRMTFTGRGKLVERPLDPYFRIFKEKGINYINDEGRLPLTIDGVLKPAEFKLEGNISSQFISGLMFALPKLNGDSSITMTSELESKPYVDLTIDMLKHFSIEIINEEYKRFTIKGNQKYSAINHIVEGDYSQAAFWIVAGVLGADIWCIGLTKDSKQGDKALLEIIERMNGSIIIDHNRLKAIPSKTNGIMIDASECPDLVPILAVLAAVSNGTTEIVKADRLRIKESNRLKAIQNELYKIGADIMETEHGLIIRGCETLTGGIVDSWNDHRIAMALAIASMKCSQPLIIKNAACVNKSYPDFWKHFRELGGDISECNLWE